MTGTVDLIVVGGAADGIRGALAAARRGSRVLIVMAPGDPAGVTRVRHAVRNAGAHARGRVTVMTGVELVCADGVGGVEAVVVRHVKSGRLHAFNARAVVA